MAGFRMTKTQISERDAHQAKLTEAAGKISDAISEYNALLDDAREFCADIAQTAQDEWDDKSEKWQESDRGTDCAGWIEGWRDVELEELDEPDFPHGSLDELQESAS